MVQAKMTLEEIRRSDPFISEDTNIDLSAYPWLTPLADTPIDDEQFAPVDTRGMGVGSSALKKFLADPGREAIEGLKDTALLKEYDEQHGSGSTVYASNVPFQIYQRGGKWYAKGATPDGALHRFSADTRDGLYPKITKAVRQNTARELSEPQRLEVIRLCQGGDRITAIGVYLKHCIGEERASEYDSPVEMMSDPRLVPVMDECANFCWFHSNPHAIDTPEWDEFKERILAGRPATFQLLDAIWLRYQDHLERENRSALLGQLHAPDEPKAADPREIESTLENASDTDIEKMMTATKREYIKQVRAGVR